MKIEIDQEDFGALCVCAVRYCQGRQTYMPAWAQRIIGGYLPLLSKSTIDVMINDCKDQAKLGYYGDEKVDKPGWLLWEQKVKEEGRRRELPREERK